MNASCGNTLVVYEAGMLPVNELSFNLAVQDVFLSTGTPTGSGRLALGTHNKNCRFGGNGGRLPDSAFEDRSKSMRRLQVSRHDGTVPEMEFSASDRSCKLQADLKSRTRF